MSDVFPSAKFCGLRRIFLNPQIAELPQFGSAIPQNFAEIGDFSLIRNRRKFRNFLPQSLAEIGEFSLIRNRRKFPPLKGGFKTTPLSRRGNFTAIAKVCRQGLVSK